jgi:processing peptidase subunit alpha
MVLSASGVEHSELLALAQDMLADIPAGKPAPKVPSVYVGGDFRLSSPNSPTTTVLLGFEFKGGWNDIKVYCSLR